MFKNRFRTIFFFIPFIAILIVFYSFLGNEVKTSLKPYVITGIILSFLYILSKRGKHAYTENPSSFNVLSPSNVYKIPSKANEEADEEEDVITFKDVAGHKEVKKDLKFLIDFMKNPEKYRKMGARMPKGIIFYGPPGTGKTLLAKAIAGEAKVPFFSVSGSDFVEKYVGVGAKRVRELFKKAREKAPCIIFIDEIDAVGRQRGQTENSEVDQTINALLTELDGFNSSEGIVVIAATNRVDMLDSALTRPGRFDRHIAIPLPEQEERLELLKLHSKNKKLGADVSLEKLAKMTIGFSGADLENLLNESAILAVSREKEEITMEEIDEALFKIILKGNKKPNDKNSEDYKLIAYHEAGHALCAKLLTNKSIPKVTIIGSTSGAGGVTFMTPKDGLHTKEDLINEIKISYAGRAAEYLYTKNINRVTTGAAQDIKQATNYIIKMINEFGMNDEIGMIDLSYFKSSGEREVLREAIKLSKQLYEETVELLRKNYDVLRRIAERLIEKETILEDELDSLIFNSYAIA